MNCFDIPMREEAVINGPAQRDRRILSQRLGPRFRLGRGDLSIASRQRSS